MEEGDGKRKAKREGKAEQAYFRQQYGRISVQRILWGTPPPQWGLTQKSQLDCHKNHWTNHADNHLKTLPPNPKRKKKTNDWMNFDAISWKLSQLGLDPAFWKEKCNREPGTLPLGGPHSSRGTQKLSTIWRLPKDLPQFGDSPKTFNNSGALQNLLINWGLPQNVIRFGA